MLKRTDRLAAPAAGSLIGLHGIATDAPRPSAVSTVSRLRRLIVEFREA